MSVANEITGRFSDRYANIENYFELKKANERLVQQNEALLNRLKQDYEAPDSAAKAVTDSLYPDTSGRYRKYSWREAKVVRNSVSAQNNYLTLHRGSLQGIARDMGVIGPEGVVGRVVDVSPNFSIVMSLLHRDSRVSARLKKTGELGEVRWDGISPLSLTMNNIPKTAQVAKGDTVMTSQYSYTYPAGIPVGYVTEIVTDPASNFYTLKLKPATNFYNVQYVFVVENLQKDEQKQLEDATLKNQ